uniref:Uncharacterized protein n=1 Tax=Auxenochlorella protothecoides TaxID=3075 RepID=A0A1D2A723_AUXPR
MIMAKFEALDRIQASSHSPGEEGKAGNVNTVGLEILAAVEERSRDGCLTDAQLLEVFKQTSIFNVKTALADNEALLSIDDLLCQYADRYGSDEEVSDDEDWIQTFWSATENGKDAVKRSSTEPRQRMPGGTTGARPSSQSRHRLVTSYNPFSQALVRRKVRVCDKNEVVTMRIPAAPLPLSWGRTVRPYSPGSSVDGQEKRGPLVSYDSWLKCKAAAATYEAALINPGWVESGDDGAGLKVSTGRPCTSRYLRHGGRLDCTIPTKLRPCCRTHCPLSNPHNMRRGLRRSHCQTLYPREWSSCSSPNSTFSLSVNRW